MSDSLQYLKGVGPSRARALSLEGITTADDLLYLVPRGYVDRSTVGSLAVLLHRLQSPTLWSTATSSEIASVTSEVSVVVTVQHVDERTIGRNRKMLVATVSDESGVQARMVFWNAIQYFGRVLSAGGTFLVSGVPEYDARFNQVTFTHPDLERIVEEDQTQLASGSVLATYSLSQKLKSAGITTNLMRSMIGQVLENVLADIREVLPDPIITARNLMSRVDALRNLHQPSSIRIADIARRRLKYEELFFFQLSLAQRQTAHRKPGNGLPMVSSSPSARALVNRLSYELTSAQRRVIHEIIADMISGAPMNRLLQGDVGSGKTVVAMLCMLNAVDNGYQTVLMAPTEILAEQHLRGIKGWLEGTNITVASLVGGQNRRARREILEQISSGRANIIVGTHALFEAKVQYNKLGLIVIDEQHRFGVAQRAALLRLGKQSNNASNDTTISTPQAEHHPHVLVMSATPIPRTLAMSVYGELDVSVIDQMPANRKPIRTKVVFESHMNEAYAFINAQVSEGRQAYIVYPLVEKSEKIDLKSAVEHYENLAASVVPNLRLGLLHGQMLPYEKDDVMQAFLKHEMDILVATTVIEVGVDVPNATVMLIENAERFGLSQLHQLRGRVGRGSHQSYCLLSTKDHFKYQLRKSHSEADRAQSVIRLRTMEETTDGFKIAEVDLELRGPGDVLGTRQSGLPEFTFANIVSDGAILAQARADAFATLHADPTLSLASNARVLEHCNMLTKKGQYDVQA